MLFREIVAIDMGTANTVAAGSGGRVYSAPTLAAVDMLERRTAAVGSEAEELLFRQGEGLRAGYPVERGQIMDCALACAVMRRAMEGAAAPSILRPLVSGAIAVSPSASDMERRLLADIAEDAGLRGVTFVSSPVAAAAGMGIDPALPQGRLIAVLGAGRSEFACVSMGGVVSHLTRNVGGQDIDRAIAALLEETRGVTLPRNLAETLKLTLFNEPGSGMTVRGRSKTTGLPGDITVTAEEIESCREDYIEETVKGLSALLADTPPELVGDIQLSGVFLCGGAATLPGLAERLADATGLTVHLSASPHSCVASGMLARVTSGAERTA